LEEIWSSADARQACLRRDTAGFAERRDAMKFPKKHVTTCSRRTWGAAARALLALLLWVVASMAYGQSCSHRLLVSGYFSTVHVYDACTGAYQRDLDSGVRLSGAQAIRLGPDGLIYVVSETTNRIHKYRADTLEYAGLFVETPRMAPLGLAFDAEGIAYVAGFTTNNVKKFDRNGALIGDAFAPRAAGLTGPEIGTTFGPDGNLYVPGYYSNNVIRYDPRTGETVAVIPSNFMSIFQPRGLLPHRDGVSMYLSTEGSSQLFRWNLATNTLIELRRNLSAPTMIAYGVNGDILVTQNDSVDRLDPVTGATLGNLVSRGSGGLSGSTYLALIPIPAPPIPPDTVLEFYNAPLDHYFITGNAAEAMAIDNGGGGPGWSRTGNSFRSGGTTAVCRFYGSQSPGPNSHFYTIDADECEALKGLQATTPVTEKRWNFESLDFSSTPPSNKSCAAGLAPVYRAYNNGFSRGIDSNHRITSSAGGIAEVVARGWHDEGTVMCAPQ
jgi:hypothetical protein